MSCLFDKYGNLNIEEIIANNSSFLKIIEDGRVTVDELNNQSSKVKKLLNEAESSFNDVQLSLIKEILAELCVLLATREIYNSQINDEAE